MESQEKIVTVTLNTAIDRVMEVDSFEVGAHMQAQELCRYPSGKGVNVSRALARLNRNSIVGGLVGRDRAKYFENNLAQIEPGKATNQLLAVQGVTRENITVLGKRKGTDTHLRTEGYELTDKDLERIVTKLGLLLRGEPVVVFAGSLPCGVDELDFANLINMAVDAQAKVVLDLQPALLSNVLGLDSKQNDLVVKDGGRDARPTDARPTDTRLTTNTDFSKQDKAFWMIAVNQRQIAKLLDADEHLSDEDILKFIKRLTTFSTWVVVALGAHEAVLANSDGEMWRGKTKVKNKNVTSTVGSGDCFLAGILDAQAQGKQPMEVLRWGLASAAANSSEIAIARFNLEQVNKWLGNITVKKTA